MQCLSNKYQLQALPALVKLFVASCNTCQAVKQQNKPPLGLVIPLHVPVRSWTDISIDFLKVTPVFIKYSTMYPNMEIDKYYLLCIACIWTIVDRHSAYKFLIPNPHNLKAEQCTRTYEVHLLPHVGYANTVRFDRHSLFIHHHFLAQASSKAYS